MTSGKVGGRVERRIDASRFRFAIVASDYHPALGAGLLAGARECFRAHGADPETIPVIRVPGAFEIPQAARRLAAGRRRWDALVCLGVLIRGDTLHFEILSREVCRNLLDAAGQTGTPMAFGILTLENERQGKSRAGRGPGNKGREAARAAIRMAGLFREMAAESARTGRRRG